MNKGYTDREIQLKDIERYFECELSDEEERDLRYRLSKAEWNCKEINEAIAVIGFGTIKNERSKSEKSLNKEKRFKLQERRRSLRFGITAAAILLLAVSITFVIRFAGIDNSNGDCIAYLNGDRVTDEEQVIEIMQMQFAELESGVDQVTKEAILEIGEMGEFLNISPE